MPDPPIKPPNKRVSELTTELTLSVHEKFRHEKDMHNRANEIITYLIKEIAILKAQIESI